MPNSKNSSALLSSYTPNGAQTLSKMQTRYPQNYPKLLSHGTRGHVMDNEGYEYIDLIAGLGAISVGYAQPYINQKVEDQLRCGVSFSLPNELEYCAAKRLTELVPGTEMWKFGKNGTDGTVWAVRCARAYTGRTKIMTVGYNGCADQFEIRGTRTAGVPKELDPTIDKAFYNNSASFGRLESKEYACVLMEPMVFDFPTKGFLPFVKELCRRTGTLLIFDEVVTGGRFEYFTASNNFGLHPDLYVCGKALANGFPLSAVGGTRRLMATFEREDFFASNTFGGECASLAAFMATQTILPGRIGSMVEKGQRIKDAFNMLDWEGAECVGYPTRLDFRFPSEAHRYLFWQELCKRRVLVGYTNFIMADHSDEDVAYISESIEEVQCILKENWENPLKVFEGPLPTPALRK